LALQIADWYSTNTKNAIYISAEENINQISERAKRLNIKNEFINILNSNNFEDILETIENDNSNLIIIDSISVVYSNFIDSNS
jgi:DNA repair protein RadA/Sms